MPSPVGLLVRLIVFAAVLLGSLRLLDRLAVPGGGDLIGSKRQVFERRAASVDTVLLGSSHVYRGIVPERLDAAFERAGVEAHTYNFGIQLPNLIELHRVLREVLEKSPGLRRVVLEYMQLVPQIDPENAFVPRSIYWHDRSGAFEAVERVGYWSRERGGSFPYVERTERTADGGRVLRHRYSSTGLFDRLLPNDLRAQRDHYLHWLANLAMIGRSKDLARGLLGRDHSQVAWIGPGSGYVSLEREERRLEEYGKHQNTYRDRRRLFQGDPEAYLKRVEKLRSEEVVFGDEEWMNSELLRVDDLEVLRRMRSDCREAGAELVVVVMPANSTNRPLERRLEAELDVPVLVYTDPDRHPELFDPELRFDSGHFNEDGAQVFTDILAADLLALIAEGRLP